MKAFTCKEMGGVCDAVIKGDTATEIALRTMNHYRETHDDAHREVVKRIEASTPEQTTAWRSGFGEQFHAAPDVE